jgi:branched-chain amino acid transport system ATP-binding protein
MNDPILAIDNLCVRYGRDEIIRNFSLRIQQGECVAIVGANGCGKTTLLRTISGHIQLFSGSIHFFGKNINRLPPWRRTRMGLIHVLEGAHVFPSMTVEENLLVGIRGNRAETRNRLESVLTRFPDLANPTMRSRPAAVLSGGERQMLVLARAILLQPKLLLLDSPFLGVGARFRSTILTRIAEISADTTQSVLLVEHDLPIVSELAHRRVNLSSPT